MLKISLRLSETITFVFRMYATGGGVKVVEPRFDAITKLMADIFKMVRCSSRHVEAVQSHVEILRKLASSRFRMSVDCCERSLMDAEMNGCIMAVVEPACPT